MLFCLLLWIKKVYEKKNNYNSFAMGWRLVTSGLRLLQFTRLFFNLLPKIFLLNYTCSMSMYIYILLLPLFLWGLVLALIVLSIKPDVSFAPGALAMQTMLLTKIKLSMLVGIFISNEIVLSLMLLCRYFNFIFYFVLLQF